MPTIQNFHCNIYMEKIYEDSNSAFLKEMYFNLIQFYFIAANGHFMNSFLGSAYNLTLELKCFISFYLQQ